MAVARGHLATCAAALLLALLGLLCTPLDTVLREDGLEYLDQAASLRAGDWTATHRSVGWPLLLAGSFELLGIDGRAESMVAARVLSVLLLAACAFPLAALARRVAGERAAWLAVLALALSPTLIWLGGIAYADALFLLLATASAAAAAASRGRLAPLLLATALASLAYWVRPNGLFLLPALLVYGALARRRAGLGWTPLLAVPLLFFAVSAPHLLLRARSFGSPFDYGPVSKVLVDSYAQVWDPTVPAPTLWQYLASHTPAQWFGKFVVRGLFKVGWYFVLELGALWTLLLGAGLWVWRRPRAGAAPDLLAPALVLAALLAGLVPAFDVAGDPRYMALMLPFVFAIGAAGFVGLTAGRARERALTAGLVLALVAQLGVAFAFGGLQLRGNPLTAEPPHVRDAWAAWTVRHVPPPVAILEGGDLLQLALAEARPTGELPAATAARADYPVRIPGLAPDLGAALDGLRRAGVGYLLVDSRNSARLAWLGERRDPRWAGRLELVREFRAEPAERWALADMEVWRILPGPGR